MKPSAQIFFLLIIFPLFMHSCKKQAGPCTGNCATINANGSVINDITNSSAANVPVSLNWFKFSGITPQYEVIAILNSRDDGTFNFTSTIDTSYFKNGYSLLLSAGSNNEYMILGYSGLISKQIGAFDPNAFQGIQFDVFKKATLILQVHRIQSDSFQSFAIYHTVVGDINLYDYNIQSPQDVTQSTSEINVTTVADVFTTITALKTFSNGTNETTTDSIKCSANTSNTFVVNF